MEAMLGLLSGLLALGLVIYMYAAKKLRDDIQEIHVMVNSRMEEALARIDQLDAALENAGIESPDRPDRKRQV